MVCLVSKWLPIIFACHSRIDRSFIINEKQFPICARCTGQLVGIIFSPIIYIFLKPSLTLLIIMMLPLIIDGTIQLITSYESNNLRRFITGFFFGNAILIVFVYSVKYFFEKGHGIGQKILNI